MHSQSYRADFQLIRYLTNVIFFFALYNLFNTLFEWMPYMDGFAPSFWIIIAGLALLLRLVNRLLSPKLRTFMPGPAKSAETTRAQSNTLKRVIIFLFRFPIILFLAWTLLNIWHNIFPVFPDFFLLFPDEHIAVWISFFVLSTPFFIILTMLQRKTKNQAEIESFSQSWSNKQPIRGINVAHDEQTSTRTRKRTKQRKPITVKRILNSFTEMSVDTILVVLGIIAIVGAVIAGIILFLIFLPTIIDILVSLLFLAPVFFIVLIFSLLAIWIMSLDTGEQKYSQPNHTPTSANPKDKDGNNADTHQAEPSTHEHNDKQTILNDMPHTKPKHVNDAIQNHGEKEDSKLEEEHQKEFEEQKNRNDSTFSI